MSAFSSQSWKNNGSGFCESNKFPRGDGTFYQNEGYVGKNREGGLMNGVSHGQFGSNRDFQNLSGSGPPPRNNWNKSYSNGCREEFNHRPGGAQFGRPDQTLSFPLLNSDQSRMHMRRPPLLGNDMRPSFSRHFNDQRGFQAPPSHLGPPPLPHHNEGLNHPPHHDQRRPDFFPPHGVPPHSGGSFPPPVEDRSQGGYPGSQFPPSNGPHGRKYDSYSSPTLSSSSWSPTIDSPESPMMSTPPPPVRGRGGGGSPHFNPVGPPPPEENHLHPQRRHPPMAPQKFIHGARIHDRPQSPRTEGASSLHQNRINSRKDSLTRRGNFFSPLSSRRGNTKEEKHGLDSADKTESSLELTNRDPRLHRKPNHTATTPVSSASSVMVQPQIQKRKQDIHLVLHQIVSEHSYSKKMTEGDAAIIKRKQERRSLRSRNRNRRDLPSSFLSNMRVESRRTDRRCPTPPVKLPSPVTTPSPMEEKAFQIDVKPSLPEPECFPTKQESEVKRTEVEEKVTVYEQPVISLDGFELDLDTEPSSSSSSSEDEMEMRNCGRSVPVAAKMEGKTSCIISLPSSLHGQSSNITSASDAWSITTFDHEKNVIRLSKVDMVKNNPTERSNQMHGSINGRIIPNRLAIYASVSSPSGSSHMGSPDASPRRHRNMVGGSSESEGEGNMEEEEDDEVQFASTSGKSSRGKGLNGQPGEEGNKQSGCKLKRKRRRWENFRLTRRKTRNKKLTNADMLDLQVRPRRIPFREFKPEILTTRSRAETATMKRRMEMKKEMEQHERERIQTARPEDLESMTNSPSSLEMNMDDLSSESISGSFVSSRDIDESSSKSGGSVLDEFSPDVIARCKKICTARNSGDTPLHKVCRTGKYEMARYLILVENASVNAQDHAGWTPLHEACCTNQIQVAELLLGSGADANMSASDGTRPIHDAIESGNLDLVKLLLKHGADPMADIGEKTPVEYALSNEQFEIHAFLEAVVKERLKSRSQKLTVTPVLSPATTPHKKPTRASKVTEFFKEAEDTQVAIPVDGYKPDDHYYGEELSYPLFYVSPVIELSDCPFLPVYNFKLSSGINPRRHNFHLISDILDTLDLTEDKLFKYCDKVLPVEITAAELIHNIESSPFHYKVPDNILALPHNKKLRFLPLCSQLRELLDIQVENLDD